MTKAGKLGGQRRRLIHCFFQVVQISAQHHYLYFCLNGISPHTGIPFRLATASATFSVAVSPTAKRTVTQCPLYPPRATLVFLESSPRYLIYSQPNLSSRFELRSPLFAKRLLSPQHSCAVRVASNADTPSLTPIPSHYTTHFGRPSLSVCRETTQYSFDAQTSTSERSPTTSSGREKATTHSRTQNLTDCTHTMYSLIILAGAAPVKSP